MRTDGVTHGAERELADAVAAVGMLRAGLTPAQAFAAIGWGEAGADGAPPNAPAAGAVAARLAHQTGAPLAPVLEALARSARSRLDAAVVAEAALAGPRLSARILAWLPVVGLAMGVVIEPGVVAVLGTVLGAVALGAAAMLTIAGRWWMSTLVARARPPESSAVVALEATRAALSAGADIRTAVASVGAALGDDGQALQQVAAALRNGAEWDAAWAPAPDWLVPLGHALALPWALGAQAAPMLSAAADVAALHERRAAQVAASELAVRLTLPLALCLLPAFIVAGIAPLILALVGGL